jgi:hypothetical protein
MSSGSGTLLICMKKQRPEQALDSSSQGRPCRALRTIPLKFRVIPEAGFPSNHYTNSTCTDV